MTKVKVTTKCFETDQIVQQLKTGAFLEYYHSSLGITSQKAMQLSVCLQCREIGEIILSPRIKKDIAFLQIGEFLSDFQALFPDIF